MRKYIRLALLSVALFSAITMLVYRYKYHSLRSIIDVMNFFPAKSTKSSECFMKQTNNMTAETALSSNHWTELFDGIYIYSPHVMKSYVFFLAYSKDAIAADLKSITCQLWFENQEKSFESKLIIHYLNRKSISHFYFECWYTSDLVAPYAVTFIKDGVSITVPIFHKPLYTGQYAACVNPSLDHFSDLNKIIEFLIYHSHIGIKHFLLYYTAFSSSIKEVLVNVANECDIVIEFLSWIRPPHYEHNSIKLQPYFIDCIFHISSLNHSNFVFLLDLNNFVFFEETKSIKQLVYDNSPFDYIQMENKKFCLDYPNNIIAQELNISFKTLLKTKMSTYTSQLNVVYDVKHIMSNVNQFNGGFKTWLLTKKLHSFKAIKSSSASIHSYTDCGSRNISDTSYLEDDTKMWSFKQMFYGSCIHKHTLSILGKDAI